MVALHLLLYLLVSSVFLCCRYHLNDQRFLGNAPLPGDRLPTPSKLKYRIVGLRTCHYVSDPRLHLHEAKQRTWVMMKSRCRLPPNDSALVPGMTNRDGWKECRSRLAREARFLAAERSRTLIISGFPVVRTAVVM